MGAATFVVGLLPGYSVIGALAPVLLVTMRVLQGLALGGNMAALRPTSPSTRLMAGGVSIRAGSRPRRRWASSLPSWSS
jgi:hypothetical protein